MDVAQFLDYFSQYGALFLFIVVLLEYLNLPGFPAGVILPLSGFLAANGGISLPVALLLSLLSGLLGSLLLYLLGRYGGGAILNFFYRRFPSQQSKIERCINILRSKGVLGVFIAKLIPMVRTIVSIPAGVIKMRLLPYLLSSAAGIFLWNLFFIGVGYLLGDALLPHLR